MEIAATVINSPGEHEVRVRTGTTIQSLVVRPKSNDGGSAIDKLTRLLRYITPYAPGFRWSWNWELDRPDPLYRFGEPQPQPSANHVGYEKNAIRNIGIFRGFDVVAETGGRSGNRL